MAEIDAARRSARGSLVLFAGNFVSTGVAAVASIIIARFLAPDLYGVYTLASVGPTIFGLLLSFGVNLPLTRYSAFYLSQGRADIAKRMTKNAIVFMVIAGCVLTIASYFGAAYVSEALLHRPSLTNYVHFASFVILGQAVFQSSIAALIGWDAMGVASLSNVIQAISKLAIGPGLVLAGFGVLGAITGNVAAYLIAGFVAIALLYLWKLRDLQQESGNFTKDVRQIIGYGLPLVVGDLANGLATQYLNVIIAAIGTNATVGYYQSATNFTVAFTVISAAVGTALLPAFASLDGAGLSLSLETAFGHAVKYVAYLVAPVIFFVAAVAHGLVLIVYGSSYLPGVDYAKLLAVAHLPLVIGLTVLPAFFNGAGRTRLTMICITLGWGSVFVTAPLLAITFGLGVGGLIYSLLLCNLLIAVSGLILAYRYMRVRPKYRPLLAITFASAISYLVATRLPLTELPALVFLLLQAAAFGVTYLTLAPLIRAIDEEDVLRLSIAIEGLGLAGGLGNVLLAYEKRLARLSRKMTVWARSGAR